MIADVDNTLFDWFKVWHATFRAMLDEIVKISGIGEDELLPEIRQIHQQYGTSEYTFLIESMPSLRRRFPDENLIEVFAEYGASHKKKEYELLVNVTHWTYADVAREKRIGERDISPTFKLRKSISELLDMFEFQKFKVLK